MSKRALSLIVFRVIILCIVLVYQLLAALIGLRALPFEPFILLITTMSTASWIYYWWLKKHQQNTTQIQRLVFVQFLLDGVALSIVVWLTGGVESNFGLSYVVIIPLSAVFLPKIGIYIMTIFCFSCYYIAAIRVPPWEYLVGNLQPGLRSEMFSYTMASQFVVFFAVALVSVFLQSAYRSTLRDLWVKEKSIRSLKRVRNRIIESMHSGLITCDLNGFITYANRTAKRLLEVEEDLQGQSAWDLFMFSSDDFSSLASGTFPHRAVKWVNLPQAKKLFGISLSQLELDPGVFGYLIVFQDLTEIKILEEKHRFEDKMATVGKVAAGVAHEIRNPLASIIGSIQVLREFTPQDREARELMSIVEKESARLETIISNFLTYTRPGSPTEMKPVDLVALFGQFLKLADNDQDIKKVVIETHFDPSSDPYILGDETKISQIWWNLLRNAAQASQAGDRIDVKLFNEDGDVVVDIRDHGCGMTESELADLFTPFQSYRKGGSGLGMSIVYELVQLHHGTIQIDSQPGKGTTVTLRFPKYHEGG